MRTRLAIAVLAAGTLVLAQRVSAQSHPGTQPSPSSAPTTSAQPSSNRPATASPQPTHHPVPAVAAAAAPKPIGSSNNGVTSVKLPPGWGLTPSPFSTVTNPSGYPSGAARVGQQGYNAPGSRGYRGTQVIFIPTYIEVPVGVPVTAPVEGAQQDAEPYVPNTQTSQPTFYAPRSREQATEPRKEEDLPPLTPIVIEPYVPPSQQPASSSSGTASITGTKDEPPVATTDTPYTLIVLKDHSIFAVTSYGVADGKLSYTTSDGAMSTVALGQLDLETTFKLNKDRNVKFELREK